MIAARIIKRGGPVTHTDLNSVLEHQNILVTENQLKELINIESQEFNISEDEGLLDVTIPKVTIPRTTLINPNNQPPTQYGVYC